MTRAAPEPQNLESTDRDDNDDDNTPLPVEPKNEERPYQDSIPSRSRWQRRVRFSPPALSLQLTLNDRPLTDVQTFPWFTAKSRIINVRLLSMAMTGYFYTFTRPRTALPMSMIKYDPISTSPLVSRPIIP